MYSVSYPSPVQVWLAFLERTTILFDDASQFASPESVLPGFFPVVPPLGLAFGKELRRWHWPVVTVERAYGAVERAAASNPSKGKEEGIPLPPGWKTR